MWPCAIGCVLLAAGCGAEHAPDAAVPDLAMPICTEGQLGDAGVPGTFANVEKILDRSCAFGVCHFPGFNVPGGPGLDLSHGHAYADLVNRTAADPPNQCGGLLVQPFHPEASYLMVKLTVPTGMQCNPKGEQMPVGEFVFQPLDDCEIDLIRRWIAVGAPSE
jgi:hypothetical protein